jgi:hypothetical protein
MAAGGASYYASPAAAMAEEEALQRLDDASTQMQREGRYLEALECMERGLLLRQKLYGVKSDEVRAVPRNGSFDVARRYRTGPTPLWPHVS